ncbi:putative protein (DUF955 domain) [Campylobacter pinnipediorum subsp. caledonicus]|uniref:IrrE N-terminal-like domain-containing protein n=1 Tax=Campylobacter pinnipediorum subsp. caledonicus TaxID=1874362 RepID=A0A1S6U667_9BACT|nr:ImmA/IrrE family metallo-endopeptidase [Campylobacter pinnipediorum]AQW85576.1 putative protein (DUF955 domain) [Campylobacter pinnipediorum subsp. caledonicus]AQW87182.1 putative protein (DUF955 domain) [Campylobacter pinnipediorum subsp. caledonicus]
MEILKWANVSSEEILQKLDLTTPPFDPFKIAELMGITVKNDLNFDELASDGMIYLNNNIPEIWINPIKPEKRQIFTLAHELGHLVYHVLPNIEKFQNPIRDDYSTLYRNGVRNPQETLANRFAANLIMPLKYMMDFTDRLFEETKGEELNRRNIIDALVGEFNVSKDAMIIRLKQLKTIPQDYDYNDDSKQKIMSGY